MEAACRVLEKNAIQKAGFAQLFNVVLNDCRFSPSLLKLYIYFRTKFWYWGNVYSVSLEEIAKELDLEKRFVRRKLKDLLETGRIKKEEIKKGRGIKNIFYEEVDEEITKEGFVPISSLLLWDKRMKSELLALYALIANYDRNGDGCFAWNETLAQKLGCHEDTIKRNLKRLVKEGFIRPRPALVKDNRRTIKYSVVPLDEIYCKPGNPYVLKDEVQKRLEAILDDKTLERIGIERKERTDELFQIQAEIEEKREKAEANAAKNKAIKNKYGKRPVESEDPNPTTKRPTVHDLERVWHREEREKSPAWERREWGMAKKLIDKYSYEVLAIVIEDVFENWTWYQKQYGLKDLKLGYLFGNMDMWIQDLDREKGDDDFEMWVDEMEEILKRVEYQRYQGKGCSDRKWTEEERKIIGELLRKYGPIRVKKLIENVFENWEYLVQRWPQYLKSYPSVETLGRWGETWITLFERGEIEVRSTRQKALDEAEYKGERKEDGDFVSF